MHRASAAWCTPPQGVQRSAGFKYQAAIVSTDEDTGETFPKNYGACALTLRRVAPAAQRRHARECSCCCVTSAPGGVRLQSQSSEELG